MKTNGPELISFYMSVLKRSLITEFSGFSFLRKSTTQNFFFQTCPWNFQLPFCLFLRKEKKEEKLGIQSHSFSFPKVFIASADFFLPLIPRDVISWVASSNYRITLSEIGKSYLRGLLLHLYLILKRNSKNSSSTTVCSSSESEESIKKTFLSLQTFRNKTLQSYFHHEMDWWLLCQFSVPFNTQNTKYYKTVRVHGGWKLLKNYHSIFFVFFADLKNYLSGQKLVENAKIRKFKCDILGHFQTMWKSRTFLLPLSQLSWFIKFSVTSKMCEKKVKIFPFFLGQLFFLSFLSNNWISELFHLSLVLDFWNWSTKYIVKMHF